MASVTEPKKKALGRPRKWASPAERQAAYRTRHYVSEFRVAPHTGATIEALAQALDATRVEVVNSLINYALLNRDWFKLGLFGKRLVRADKKGKVE